MRILLVRHAEATGQDPGAELTENGLTQAREISEFIRKFFKISRILSSPYMRAVKTIEPLAELNGLSIEPSDDLVECYYAEEWCEETAEQGLERGLKAIKHISTDENDGIAVIVSHGDLIKLLLKHFGKEKSFVLTRPDLYLLDTAASTVTRMWSDAGVPAAVPRPSARAVLFSHDRAKVFLFELGDPSIGSRSSKSTLWIAPGGGVEDGEDLIVALYRELFEELGLSPSDYQILGRLWTSQTPMIYHGEPRLFADNFFAVQLACPAKQAFKFENQTDSEKLVLKRFKWWSLPELHITNERIVPSPLHKLSEVNLDSLSMTEPLVIVDEPI